VAKKPGKGAACRGEEGSENHYLLSKPTNGKMYVNNGGPGKVEHQGTVGEWAVRMAKYGKNQKDALTRGRTEDSYAYW